MSEDIGEFDIISKYFTPDIWREDVHIGVGDDCAILTPPTDKQLATTVDTLIAGVHFPNDTSPEDIAYKAIAVCVSDLAAMGAKPAWLTLALTIPNANSQWLLPFSKSFSETAKMFEMQLIGGDTTRGSLSVTVQATGFVEPNHIMRRDRARPGDSIYVTGTLGDAALGLKHLSDVDKNILGYCINRLNRPTPRIEFGCAVAEYCSCAIDISDGLVADLGHILEASQKFNQCGAEIVIDNVPVSRELSTYFGVSPEKSGYNQDAIDWEMVMCAGDDYELCLVIAEQHVPAVTSLAESMSLPLTRIGVINSQREIRFVDASGESLTINKTGYNHF
jgi:thiamine-monophosphate kinase